MEAGIEVADIVRRFEGAYLESRGGSLPARVQKAFRAIRDCRTAALGGHLYLCPSCGAAQPRYNSCRNRHCPKCQGKVREEWVQSRCEDLLPVEYFHVVFTVPDEPLYPVFRGDPRALYGILFRAVAQTLTEIAGDPKYLGAKIGFLSILHTWGQQLQLHPHLHCVVPGGGLSPTGEWISCRPGFFLPIRVLADRFRNLFIDLLDQAVRKGGLRLPTDLASNPSAFRVWLDGLRHKRWVVYSKPPFGGPAAVMQYLGRYTHRVAISNARLLAVDEETVTYRWKDYRAGGCWKVSVISGVEFLRRFAQHILPDGFVRIRYYGLLANRGREERIAQCRDLLDADGLQIGEIEAAPATPEDAWRCPVCGEGELVLHGPLSEMPPARPSVENARAPPRRSAMN